MRKPMAVFFSLFFVFGAARAELPDFVDPLKSLFSRLEPNMSHHVIERILRTYPAEKSCGRTVSPHETKGDSNELSSISLCRYVDNIFEDGSCADGNCIGSSVYIYFIGRRAACIFYRYDGEDVHEAHHKGVECDRFLEAPGYL